MRKFLLIIFIISIIIQLIADTGNFIDAFFLGFLGSMFFHFIGGLFLEDWNDVGRILKIIILGAIVGLLISCFSIGPIATGQHKLKIETFNQTEILKSGNIYFALPWITKVIEIE